MFTPKGLKVYLKMTGKVSMAMFLMHFMSFPFICGVEDLAWETGDGEPWAIRWIEFLLAKHGWSIGTLTKAEDNKIDRGDLDS